MAKKVAIITGVSKGIGQALADRFEAQSIVTVGFSRTAPRGRCSHWVQGDVTDENDRLRLKNEVLQKYGSVDILLNNAGHGLLEKWEHTAPQDLRTVFETNFFSLVEMSTLFLDELQKTRGSLINVSSVLGKVAMPCMGGYSASKFAVEAFSSSLRPELASRGIHVLNLTVGAVKTDFFLNSQGSMTSPPVQGMGCPKVLAKKVYKAYLRKKTYLTYPSWYSSYIAFSRMVPAINDYLCRKQWKL